MVTRILDGIELLRKGIDLALENKQTYIHLAISGVIHYFRCARPLMRPERSSALIPSLQYMCTTIEKILEIAPSESDAWKYQWGDDEFNENEIPSTPTQLSPLSYFPGNTYEHIGIGLLWQTELMMYVLSSIPINSHSLFFFFYFALLLFLFL